MGIYNCYPKEVEKKEQKRIENLKAQELEKINEKLDKIIKLLEE